MPRFELDIPVGFDTKLTLTPSHTTPSKPDRSSTRTHTKKPKFDAKTERFIELFSVAADQIKRHGFTVEPTSPQSVHNAVNALRTFVSQQLFPQGFNDASEVTAKITPVATVVFQHHDISHLPPGDLRSLRDVLTQQIFEAVEMGPVPLKYKPNNLLGALTRSS